MVKSKNNKKIKENGSKKTYSKYIGYRVAEWEIKYEEYIYLWEEFKKKESNLRFKRNYVNVNEIAEQFYCEVKLKMMFLYGEIKTEEMVIGREAHERLVEGALKIGEREAWKGLLTKDSFGLAEILFLAKYKNVFIKGRPDGIFFKKGIPMLIFEFKFSNYRKVFPSYHIQAQTYGILLRELGFKTTELYYVIITAPLNMRNNRKVKSIIYFRILNSFLGEFLLNKEKKTYEIHNFNLSFYKFNPIEAEQKLDWALEFWKNERDAIPTDNTNKCKRCKYNKKCEYHSKNKFITI